MRQRVTLGQRVALAASAQMRLSLNILKMPQLELAQFLSDSLLSNPFLKSTQLAGIQHNGAADTDPMLEPEASKPSLFAHVGQQIALTFREGRMRQIALASLEALDRNGWLTEPLEQIALQTSCTAAEVQQVLSILQGFEPAGLFARSLSECLRLQAEQAGKLTWELDTFLRNLELLADNRLEELADACDCLVADIPDLVKQLRAFDPKPGLRFDRDPVQLAPADVQITRTETGWQVNLNEDSLPTISINEPIDGLDKFQAEARAALNEARQIIRAVQNRNTTVQRVAACLVRHQSRFLDCGGDIRVPLSLRDVGEELHLHPSTICRSVIGRVLETPTGRIPLKHLFCRAFPQDANETVSQDTVGQILRSIVDQEPPTRPFSDNRITVLAQRHGLRMARRTVAKYRRKLGIPTSYQRTAR